MKEHADYVAKLRRVGKGLGVYQFDAVSALICSLPIIREGGT